MRHFLHSALYCKKKHKVKCRILYIHLSGAKYTENTVYQSEVHITKSAVHCIIHSTDCAVQYDALHCTALHCHNHCCFRDGDYRSLYHPTITDTRRASSGCTTKWLERMYRGGTWHLGPRDKGWGKGFYWSTQDLPAGWSFSFFQQNARTLPFIINIALKQFRVRQFFISIWISHVFLHCCNSWFLSNSTGQLSWTEIRWWSRDKQKKFMSRECYREKQVLDSEKLV